MAGTTFLPLILIIFGVLLLITKTTKNKNQIAHVSAIVVLALLNSWTYWSVYLGTTVYSFLAPYGTNGKNNSY